MAEPEAPEPLARWEGEPAELWRTRWELPYLEIHARLGSTNDRARALLRGGCEPHSTVIAEEQTAGRGRAGRTWHSPPGAGLWLSTTFPGRGDEPGLTLLVGIAVARAIEEVAPGLRVEIEWPNDVVIDGGKVAGILCERLGAEGAGGVVVGIGVNVSQRVEDFGPAIRQRATSLELATGSAVSRSSLAGAVLHELRRVPRREAGLPVEAWEALRERDALRGRLVEGSGGLRGLARGIALDGSLEVEVEGSVVSVRAGSVRPAGES